MTHSVRRMNARALSWRRRFCRYWQLYLLILPGVFAVFFFHYIPIYGVQIAFKDYRSSLGILGSAWVGLAHFRTFLNHPYAGRIIWNTMRISLYSLALFPVPIVFSLMLNEMSNGRLKRISQMITYAPHFVSVVVVCSMISLFLHYENGLVNILLGFFGVPNTSYLEKPELFAPIFAISGLWQNLGWNTIIYLAALSSLPPENIEAAKIDGASKLQIIRYVTIPHLIPTIITLFILRMGSLMSVGFEKVFLLQNQLNKSMSEVISTYVYQVGLVNNQFSYSAAIGLFNNLIDITLILTTNQLAKWIFKTSLW